MPGNTKARQVSVRRLAGCATTLALVLVLAACSIPGAGSGGADFSLGLAGSTADHPSQPPQLAAAAPGGGIMLYDLGDAQYQRVWQVLTPVTTVINGGTTSYYSSGNTGFGDVAVTTTGNLYFTQYTLSKLGAVGQIGSASLHEYSLQALSDYVDLPPDDLQVPHTLASDLPLSSYSDQGQGAIFDLGIAYTDAAGNVVTGAWQLSPRGGTLAAQYVDGVDTKAGVVSSHFVSCSDFDYFNCSPKLQAAGKQPITAHGAMSVSPDGQHIAYSSDALYVQNVDGGGAAKLAGAGWITAPAWSPYGLA